MLVNTTNVSFRQTCQVYTVAMIHERTQEAATELEEEEVLKKEEEEVLEKEAEEEVLEKEEEEERWRW